jgi:DNA-binding NtrC family response regulator
LILFVACGLATFPLGRGETVREQIDRLISEMVSAGVFFQDAVSEFEKRYIRKVLEASGGNQSRAANALGIHRNTLGRKLEQYHLISMNGSRSRATAKSSLRKNSHK